MPSRERMEWIPRNIRELDDTRDVVLKNYVCMCVFYLSTRTEINNEHQEKEIHKNKIEESKYEGRAIQKKGRKVKFFDPDEGTLTFTGIGVMVLSGFRKV